MNYQADRKEISEQIYFYMDTDFFSGEISDIAKRIESIPDKLLHGDSLYLQEIARTCHKFEIKCEWEYDTYDCKLYAIRWETEEEFEKRMQQLERAKEAGRKSAAMRKIKKEEQERKLLDKLKEKYETKN